MAADRQTDASRVDNRRQINRHALRLRQSTTRSTAWSPCWHQAQPAQIGPTCLSFDAAKANEMRGCPEVSKSPVALPIIARTTWRAFQAAEMVEADGPCPLPGNDDEHWDTPRPPAFSTDDLRDSRKLMMVNVEDSNRHNQQPR